MTLSIPFDCPWYNEDGTESAFTDPCWIDLMNWQKELVDFYGQDELQTFIAGQGDEWNAENGLQTGRVAMNLDGEWRTAFIADGAPDLNYMTAPMPMPDDLAGSTARTGRRHDHRHPARIAAPGRGLAARVVDGDRHGHARLHGEHRPQRADDVRGARSPTSM